MENQKIDSDTENIINEKVEKLKNKFDPKEYYLKNKENYKKYYETRKAKTFNIKKDKILCEICNCNYSYNHKSHHFKTKKHILNAQNKLENKDDIIAKVDELLILLKEKYKKNELKELNIDESNEFYFDTIYCYKI
jgi:hypothetical protein